MNVAGDTYSLQCSQKLLASVLYIVLKGIPQSNLSVVTRASADTCSCRAAAFNMARQRLQVSANVSIQNTISHLTNSVTPRGTPRLSATVSGRPTSSIAPREPRSENSPDIDDRETIRQVASNNLVTFLVS